MPDDVPNPCASLAGEEAPATETEKRGLTLADFRRRWRKWVPATIGFFALLGLFNLSAMAYHSGWWFRHQYELLHEIRWTLGAGMMFLGWYAGYQLAVTLLPDNRDPLARWVNVSRVLETGFCMALAMKVGCRYMHLCAAGSRWIELGAAFGTPLVVGPLVGLVRARWLAYLLAACVLTAVCILARPYLDWAHGEPIRWFR